VIVAGAKDRSQLLSYLESVSQGSNPRLRLPTYRAQLVEIDGGEELHIDDERVETPDLGPMAIGIIPNAVTVLV
jgi:hypothetical protein